MMKYSLIFLLLCTSVVAGELNTEQENALNTAKSFIASFERRDADTALSLLSEDAVLEMPFPLVSGEGSYGTRKIMGEPLRQYISGIPIRNSKIAFHNKVWQVTTAGVVVFEAKGDLIRKNGKPYKNDYLMLFYIDKGKVLRWKEYFNPVVAARTFGIPLESLP